ncbi:YXWGXW repeat-containing protein [Pseudorhodoferax soli]|uniref:YXWGXW repeat-containing protein n=1 Tax=Pseudorhodoferax soli TaxID=545864 RepID=A0A368XCQ9_9BURK|nr:YXWGXW repeat-containing protein [Pseudorhodoferax soli]RCW65751.1 YXWGXW repeat-containing protein [Pseudorhodoferax soli]
MQAAVSYLSRRRLALAALVAGCALLSACTTVVREPAQQHHVVVREVPAPLVEVIPGPPGPGLHWVPGHWAWREGDWRWFGGRYVASAVPPMPAPYVEMVPAPPSAMHVWVRGHWYWSERGWAWARGTWVRR